MLKTIRKKIMVVSGHVGLAGIALILLFSMNRLFVANLFTAYDLSCYDWFLTHQHTREKSDVPVIVDIDEQSLERYGQWPWPRYKIAELIDRISGAGPLAVGLDILFPEADRTSPVNLNAFLKKEFDLDIPNHRAQAFQAAVDMLNALGKLNDTFVKEYGFTLNIGIGLHIGRVRVGNMGTKDLFNYTIIGDNVNVASRLENLSKFYGVRIIFSEDMKTYVPRTHQIQELDLVRIRGRQEPLKIYGLFTGKFMADSDKHIAAYYHALRLYREQKFGRALEIFEQFRQKRVDRRLYKIYRQRCKYYLTHPPGKSWDGIFTHQQK